MKSGRIFMGGVSNEGMAPAPPILEIWVKQNTEFSLWRYLAKLKSGPIFTEGVSDERFYPQDYNGENISLIRQPVNQGSKNLEKQDK